MRQRRRAGRQIVPPTADPPGTPMTRRARITGLLARWRRPALITDCDSVPGPVPRGSPITSARRIRRAVVAKRPDQSFSRTATMCERHCRLHPLLRCGSHRTSGDAPSAQAPAISAKPPQVAGCAPRPGRCRRSATALGRRTRSPSALFLATKTLLGMFSLIPGVGPGHIGRAARALRRRPAVGCESAGAGEQRGRRARACPCRRRG